MFQPQIVILATKSTHLKRTNLATPKLFVKAKFLLKLSAVCVSFITVCNIYGMLSIDSPR